jgi:uncharacterized membrane protein
LRSALLNWWQSEQRSAPPPAVPITTPAGGAAVANIRELYRQVLRLGASVGATRPTAATPYEHLATLQALLSPADDLAVITQAYVEARYADSEPTPAELDRLVARWQRVQPLTRSDGV